MQYAGELTSHQRYVIDDISERIPSYANPDHSLIERQRVAIYATRMLLMRYGDLYRDNNRMVSIIARRCRIPHASGETASHRATDRFPRVAAAIGNMLVAFEESPAQAIGEYARQIDISTPDARDSDRVRLFSEPLRIMGIRVEQARLATHDHPPTFEVGPRRREFIIPMHGNDPAFENISWLSPYKQPFVWNIGALMRWHGGHHGVPPVSGEDA